MRRTTPPRAGDDQAARARRGRAAGRRNRSAVDDPRTARGTAIRPAGAADLNTAVRQLIAAGDRVADQLARVLATDDGSELARSLADQAVDLGSGLGRVAEALSAVACGPPPVAVRTLGGLAVFRGGVPVPATCWQSKKARDLLTMLIAQRGQPVPRDRLMEQLWPDESPVRTGNRLSVLLSILRKVLDTPDGGTGGPPIVADRSAVRIDVDTVDVDVERFLSAAADALAAHHARAPDAAARLSSAEVLYTGDFLADDPYAEWAQPLRDETTSAYVSVLRALAGLAGDIDQRAPRLLRLIQLDPYDEAAHLDLVDGLREAGRYGEADRRHRAYVTRMTEIGVDPATPAGPLLGAVPDRRRTAAPSGSDDAAVHDTHRDRRRPRRSAAAPACRRVTGHGTKP